MRWAPIHSVRMSRCKRLRRNYRAPKKWITPANEPLTHTPGPFYGVTVKLVGLLAVPPAVVMTIFPVFAPVGTVAVT